MLPGAQHVLPGINCVLDLYVQAQLEDAEEVALFERDPDMSPVGLMKKASAASMGGWWLGGTHMRANEKFLPQVQAKIPRNSKVIVACQKGLRCCSCLPCVVLGSGSSPESFHQELSKASLQPHGW